MRRREMEKKEKTERQIEFEKKQEEYGFKADEIFKTALADKIVEIIKRIPEDLTQIEIKSTENLFQLSWSEKRNESG